MNCALEFTLTRSYTVRLASLRTGTRYHDIEFSRRIERTEAERMALAEPIGARIFGDHLDYGSLFAYLFRRFGYPNVGWDDYKQLVQYYLSTPDPDMVLSVTPCISGSLRLSYSFYVADARHEEVEQYDRRPLTEWRTRCLDWVEARGLPEWMPQWLSLVNEHLIAQWNPDAVPGSVTTWRESLRYAFALGQEGDPFYEATSRAATFVREFHVAYQEVEAVPNDVQRSPDIEAWPEDDPLKPLALAARATLTNLMRGVRVRDSVINALGEDDSGRNPLREPAVAGYPSGALGNVAHSEVAEIHQLAHKLGRGNLRKGLRAILEKFSDE